METDKMLGAVFYAVFVLCCVPCCVLCGVAKIGNYENPLFFVGRKTYAAFERKGRSDQISQGLGWKNQPKNSCRKSPHWTTEQVSTMTILEVKIGPKMNPGGLRKRVRTTVGN